MAVVCAAGDLSGHEQVRVFGRLRPDLAAEERDLHALPLAGSLTCEQGAEDPRNEILRGDVIGDGDADRGGWIPVAAGGADQAAGRLTG